MNRNPNYLYLQDRPDNYGGAYSREEIDKFIKQAAKKGRTKVVDFSHGGKKYDVEKEMKRITGKNNFTLTKNKSGSKKTKSKKTKSKKPKKILSRSSRMSLRRRSSIGS